MGLFSIRGTLAIVGAALTFGIAAGLGASRPVALVAAVVAGPVVLPALFAFGPQGRAVDRAERWLRTPNAR
ncbi:hypothetical protein SK069_12075 [Patulibacter brassicae]|uniref:Uncharacterized protein n=1 Tax=Patulibacter brassicae TaxID=1705717 RepID=A0ABU4VKH7_9ACTN|nr:hypothetical protein [Patulibacter brassicae]MDX8152337.1 hypothetical protein [Patulibacter brassicae]